MSETENQNRQSPVVDADFDESAYREADAPGAAPPRKRSLTRWLWILLLLAAAAVAGYWYFAGLVGGGARTVAADEEALAGLRRDTSTQLAAIRDSLADIDERLAAVESRGSGAEEDLDSLRESLADFGEMSAAIESFESRLQSVERSLDSLQGIPGDARDVFLLAEAEYYMQIANAQLQLAGNPELAALALEQADDRLSQLADPALTDVRRALADERAALEVMEQRDIAGVTLTLGSLAQVVESLPVQTSDAELPDTSAAPVEDESGLDRAWQSVKNAFGGVFEYTAPTDPDRPLLTPGSEPLIRSNLALQLQAARLALLRGEQELFRQSLDDAERWLTAYFDTGSASVAGALDTVRDIRDEYRQSERPDISESLRLLRQYQALAETAR